MLELVLNGVISDGASTNRKLRSELGISGKTANFANSVKHPLDDKKIKNSFIL